MLVMPYNNKEMLGMANKLNRTLFVYHIIYTSYYLFIVQINKFFIYNVYSIHCKYFQSSHRVIPFFC